MAKLLGDLAKTLTGETFYIYVAGKDVALSDYLSARNPTLLKELVRFSASKDLNLEDYGPLLFILGARAYQASPSMDKMSFLYTSFVCDDGGRGLSGNEQMVNLPRPVANEVKNSVEQFMRERGTRQRNKTLVDHVNSLSKAPPANLFANAQRSAEYTVTGSVAIHFRHQFIRRSVLGWQASKIPPRYYSGNLRQVREMIRAMHRLGFNLPTALLSV